MQEYQTIPTNATALKDSDKISISVTMAVYEIIFTGRNEVLAKVIFLHVCVILFTGGVSAWREGGLPGGGSAWRGVSAWRGGVCL